MKSYKLILLVFASLMLAFGAFAAQQHVAGANTKVLDPGDIVKDSTKFAGNTVTVRGTVDKILADGVFTLKEHKMTTMSNLLVIFPNGKMDTPVAQGATFLVTGEVRGFAKGDLESKYGITGAKPDLVSSYDGKAVLIGTSITTAAGTPNNH